MKSSTSRYMRDENVENQEEKKDPLKNMIHNMNTSTTIKYSLDNTPTLFVPIVVYLIRPEYPIPQTQFTRITSHIDTMVKFMSVRPCRKRKPTKRCPRKCISQMIIEVRRQQPQSKMNLCASMRFDNCSCNDSRDSNT
mmetsp:Transcript_19831/g.40578  ORF Transcript_19831/g.40578 Transcript_19831/m.40578 type:complete len:138 (-) Transcript_19831:703-1116(-)